MRIGILTGGGDVPGLNPCVKGVVTGALEHGWTVVGIRRGWGGLLNFERDNEASRAEWLLPLDAENTRRIHRDGGTFLHTSRTNPGRVPKTDVPQFLQGSADGKAHSDDPKLIDFTAHVLRNLEYLGIDVLVAIGGDDTLSYADRLHREGFPVVGIPKTMDNDVHGTEYCLGFGTCVSRSVQYINQLRTSTGSHERFAVIEVMGRNAGFTSLVPAYLTAIDRALIAEVPFDVEKLARFLSDDRKHNPSGYAMVTISEGAQMHGAAVVERGEADAYGHRKLGGVGQMTGEALKKLTGTGIIYQQLGYLVRSGPPDPIDVMATFNFANLAIELLVNERFGQLVRVKDGVYGHAPLSVVSEGLKRVDVAKYYDAEAYRPRIQSVLGAPLYLM